ncbi:hypothetical protein B0T25DRAFT_528023 [Lasiosphaeria hispida]|uniref:Autophagy-related protein 29 n=1 Tax=Lasiosphaeria hispida TaxID=260671 RepID=A0AAJ0MKA3_9PEZI|nr:hypothetical protein B0T25DRAFT_528023 [Lasiosphaeria hispida]
MSSKEKHEREKEPIYVVYVRLPFERGAFDDPLKVNWDEQKSEYLWSIISGSQTDINWNNLASQFEVTVDFLLQMAAFLTERHTSQLKAQMRKAATAHGSNAPSPVPGAEPAGYPGFPTAEVMRRTGSGGGRTHSALSIRKDSPIPRNDIPAAGPSAKAAIPMRPQVSRNSSAGTAVVTQNQLNTKNAARADNAPRRPRLPSIGISTAQPSMPYGYDDAYDPPRSPSPVASTSSSSSSSESPVQSRIIRRPPRFQPSSAGGDGTGDLADDDDDEAEPAFLPYQPPSLAQQRGSTYRASGSGGGVQDLGATLRGDVRDFARRLPRGEAKAKELAGQSQTSDSSTSSAAMVPRRGVAGAGERKPPGPLSPRRTAELAGAKGRGVSREGSDGTPSMGSSFSDLDDASVTQSALEEALASRMQDGTIGSRMSTIGQAIRSRYLPKANKP